ncbi:tail fiber domain-containing protein [Hymenobacter sp. BRD128]|uniref:tail fiber domain-containing protein n=1 Tax=Hymenobacter sp. BRD128 TaxID=2675878 RepID=UPI0015667F84|nr:tail fiber domain-containing protein [Hymenobacter sp. BRD128]QKG55694.1 tail fiber domain-containing protein [Hymenobacter sp. BRD128]
MATGQSPYSVAVSGTTACVVNFSSNTLQTFDLSAGRVVAVNPDGSFASVASPTLSVNGQNLSISGGNTVALPIPSLTGDITSTGTTTTYNNVVPASKGGAGALSGILKANGSGTVSQAVAGTDYLTPTGSAAGLTNFPTLNQSTTGNAATATLASTVTTNANLTGAITSTGNTTSYATVVPASKGGAGTVSGLLKADGSGNVAAAVAGTDYLTPAAAGTGFIQNGTTQQATSNFNVSGAGTVGGLLTAGGATINGATTVTGPAAINTSGTASTRIGNGTGGVILPGLSTAGLVTNSASGQLGTTAAASLGTSFILNQTSQQSGANFNVSGAGTVGGALTAGTAAITGNATVGGTSTTTGNAYVNGSLGVALNGQDRPFITRGYDAFASGNYQGAGRWGLFMEPSRLTFGIPAIADRHFQWVSYNDNSTVASTLMFLSQIGNLGIGTASPAGGLHVVSGNGGPGTGVGTAGAVLSGAPGQPPYLELRGSGTGTSTTTPYLDFAEASDQDYTTRLISLGGVLNVNGNGTNGVLLQVNGGLRAISYANISDARFKTNVRPLAGALASVLALRGVRYEWNTLGIKQGGTAGAPQVGVLAQEVEKIYPELVSTDKDGYKAVNYAQLTPVLIEALKEQQAQIEALKAKATAAEAKADAADAKAAQATATLDTFEARLRRLEAATEVHAQR